MIRRYEPRDEDAVWSLIETTLREFGFGAFVGGARNDLENASVTYAGDRAGFWVAEEEGHILGTIAIRPKENATCELKRLYVSAAARGRGVGGALYVHAEAFARSAGYEKIWLDSSRKFTAARKLYEKNGFVLLEELDNDWQDNVYEKNLKPDLSDLERRLFVLRGALEILLDFDMYDRYGAQHDSEEGRAEHAAVATRASHDHERVTRELSDLVARIRLEDTTKIARWAELHVAYLRSLPFVADSTEAFVRDEECAAWSAVARGEQAFVKENVFYVKIDPARYAKIFGFEPKS
jgi:ribosomal protein S18 acetylase RimI-like enzyme